MLQYIFRCVKLDHLNIKERTKLDHHENHFGELEPPVEILLIIIIIIIIIIITEGTSKNTIQFSNVEKT